MAKTKKPKAPTFGIRDGYVKSSEVKRFFSVSTSTINKWIHEGCPRLAIGENYRFSIPKVEAWLFSRNTFRSSR